MNEYCELANKSLINRTTGDDSSPHRSPMSTWRIEHITHPAYTDRR